MARNNSEESLGCSGIIGTVFLILCIGVGCILLWKEIIYADEWNWIDVGGRAALCPIFFFAAMTRLTGALVFMRFFLMTIGISLISLSGFIIWHSSVVLMPLIITAVGLVFLTASFWHKSD